MHKSSSKRKLLFLTMFFAIILIAAWTTKTQSSNKQTAQTKPITKTIEAKESSDNIAIEISGFVRGENRADISPMISGRILRIFKHEGESVKKGEILAIIEATQSDAQFSAASAGVATLQKTLSDSEKYYNQLVDQAKAASKDSDSDVADENVKSAKKARDMQIQAMKSQLVSAQGSLEIAKAGKNNATLISPFSGTITTIYGREGGFANFSAPLLNVSTQSSFEIETYISASQGRSITVGNIASFQLSNKSPISGVVTNVSVGADPGSLKTLVRVHLDDPTGSIRLGDFLHGQIMTPRQNATISIPKNAIVSRGGDPVVFILDENNVANERSVKIGAQQDGLVEIIEGIDVGQKIVTEGQQYLINGITTSNYATN